MPCHFWNFWNTMAGITAMHPTKRQAGRSYLAEVAAMGSAFPDTREHRGKINVRSMMFAPRILPTESEDCFLMMAVTVVTSSGREVPRR